MIHSAKKFQHALLRWYASHRRDLPWRVPQGSQANAFPDAYLVMVSEAMLQQTQVSTVVPYFKRFIKAFPTIHALAHADEQDVLRLWQGLGYYRRARNLRVAARQVLEEFGGRVPLDVASLRRLPGIGRYTAGAIASLAFGRREPIVDGNIIRVISRIDCIEADSRQRPTVEQIWARAGDLLPQRRVADFNSALMELGATICTPKKPQCPRCPVRESCSALATGRVEQIPPSRVSKPSPLNRRTIICAIRDRRGRTEVLIEQRPAKGRWAGMWQFITVESPAGSDPDWKAVSLRTGRLLETRRVAQIKHQLTHRRYEFDVFAGRAVPRGTPPPEPGSNCRWVPLSSLSDYPLPRPHVLVGQMLAEQLSQPPRLA